MSDFKPTSVRTLMMGLSAVVVAAELAVAAPAAVYYVTPTGGGDGSSWDSAMTLAAGLEAATGGGELWLKKGTYTFSAAPAAFAPTAEVVIRGGFDGESAAADRAAGAKSTIDGENTYDALVLANTAAVTLERIVLTRGYAHGLDKSGAGNLTLVDCEINSNGRTLVNTGGKNYGRGLRFVGTTETELVVSNCTFAGNLLADDDFDSKKGAAEEYGTAMYLSTAKNVLLYGTTFVTNGVPFDKSATARPGNGNFPKYQGAVLFVTGATTMTAERCRFVANRGCTAGSSQYVEGALVYSNPQNGKQATFRNCVFAGNEVIGPAATAMSCILYLSSYQGGTTIESCTFAYNLCRSTVASAVYCLWGTTKVRNSIFHCNLGETASADAVDLSMSKNAITTAYSVFDGTGTDYIASSVTQGEGVATGDPRFVTSTETFLSYIENDSPDCPRMAWPFRFKPEKVNELVNIDLHLLSAKGYVNNAGEELTATASSPAIDKGDPANEAWRNEPGENGERLNCGAYGGTSEASQTAEAGQPEITDDDIVISFVGGYTQPQIDFALGGEGQSYLATVRILCGTGALARAGTAYCWTNDLANVANGDPVTWKLPVFVQEREVVYCRVIVDAEGAEMRTANAHMAAEGEYPAWSGKGGGPTVLHVWPGAPGDCDGSDWGNAYTSFDAAFANLSPAKTEIWVATNMPFDATSLAKTYAFSRDLVIRGGFTARENAPEERPADALTDVDCAWAPAGLKLSVDKNVSVRLERFRLRRSTGRALTLTHAGATFTLADSRVEENVKGMTVDASSGKYLVVKNCVFAGNVMTEECPGTDSGRALYVKGGWRTTIDDSLFVSNGVGAAYAAALTGNGSDSGPAFATYLTPVTVRNTRFVANRLRNAYNGGSGICVISFGNQNFPVADSAFTNCLWTGNEECDGGNLFHSGMGMVSIPKDAYKETCFGRFEFVNCTFGFNVSGAPDGNAAAINSYGGALWIRNSIFYANLVKSGNAAGSDIHLLTGSASADIDYSLFGTTETNKHVTGTNVTIGRHNVFASPRFVTTDAAFLACVEKGGTGSVSRFSDSKSRLRFDTNEVSAVSAFNAHLRGRAYVDETTGASVEMPGRTSPAVDAGDPASEYGNEPEPNGRRINLGFYGNTPYATNSKSGTVMVVR